MLADELGLEGALASRGMSSGNSPNSPLSVFALSPLRALPVTLVTGIALVVTEMLGHFGFQRPLHQHLGQLLEQAILANQIFGFLVFVSRLSANCINSGFGFGRLVRFATVITSP